MHKIFVGIMLMASLVVPSTGKCMDTGTTAANTTATASFTWDANTESDLAGYKLYCSTDAITYSFVGATSDTNISVTLELAKGAYCAVTAYNNYGLESTYSNVVRLPPMVTPTAPKNVKGSARRLININR